MRRLIAAVLVIVLALFADGPGMRPVLGQTNLPPAALALAHRLNFVGAPFVGDRPQGNFGPWLIWGHRNLFSARILSAGPAGARGQFDYFDPPALRGNADNLPALPRGQAIRVARRWLTRAGMAIPGRPRVTRINATIIGGTGLCCWRHPLDRVVFGGVAIVYVAPSRRVVQANYNPRGPYPVTPRCRNRNHRDNRGVRVGVFCFSYPDVAARMWPVLLGGHQPYLTGPGWLTQVTAAHAGFGTLLGKIKLHRVSLSSTRAVYTASKGSARYRFIQVAAFPALRRASIWPVVKIERIGA